MNGGKTRLIDKFQAPFGKQVELMEVALDNDVTLLRLRIREGSRFTVIDLDPVTARRWGAAMATWAAAYPHDEEDDGARREPTKR